MTAATNPGKYVDFDEYVGIKLEKTRSTIRTTDILTAAAGVAAMTLGYLLLFVILDQWVVPGGFGVAWRMTLLSMLVASAVVWLVWKVAIPSFRTVNSLFAAREIEKAEPDLKSSLLNLVDLKAAGRPVNPVILQAIERQTAVRLQQVDVSSVIDHRPLVRTAYLLLAVIIVFCIYAMLSPKKISSSIWRGLVPLTQVPLATITEILDVKPGDISVPVHQPFIDVQVDLTGEIPAQVLLLYSTADGKKDQPLELRADDDAQSRYRGQLIGDSGQGLVQDITYFVRAGDATSRTFRIHVEQPPYADIESLRVEYPTYMKLLPVEQIRNGTIDAWEGATVTVNAKTNMPVRSGTIQFLDDPQAGPNGEEVTMAVTAGGNRLQAQWTLALRADGTFPKHYRIHCKTEDDRVTTGHVNYPMTTRPDAAPQVTLVQPEHDFDAPANATIPLLIQAHDPDFELGYVYLNVEKSGQRILHEQLSEGRVQRLTLKHDLELKRLQAATGDTLEMWVEAHDNKRPRPNSRNTPKVKIRVVQPVSKQEAEEQLAAQKERLDQKMAEANDDANPETENPRERDPKEQLARNEERPENINARREDQDEQPAERPQDEPKQTAEQQQQKDQNKSGRASDAGESKSDSGQSGASKKAKDPAGTPDETKNDSRPDGSKQSKPRNDGTEDDEVIRRINEKLKQDQEKRKQDGKSQSDPSADPANEKEPDQSKAGDPNTPPTPESDGHSKAKDGPSSERDQPTKSDKKPTRKEDRQEGTEPEKGSSNEDPSVKKSDPKKESDSPQRSKDSTANQPAGNNQKMEKKSSEQPSDGDSKDSVAEKNEKEQDGAKPDANPSKEAGGTDKPGKTEPKPDGKPDSSNESQADSTKPSKTEAPDDGAQNTDTNKDGTKKDGTKKDEGKSAEKRPEANKLDNEKSPGAMKASEDGEEKGKPDSAAESGTGEKKSNKGSSDKNAEKKNSEKSGSESASNSEPGTKKDVESTKESTEQSSDSSDESKASKKKSDANQKGAKKNGSTDTPSENPKPGDANKQEKQGDKSGTNKSNENAKKEKADKSPDDGAADADREQSADAASQRKDAKPAKSMEKQSSANEQEGETASKSDPSGKDSPNGSSAKQGKPGAGDSKTGEDGKQDGLQSDGKDSKDSSESSGKSTSKDSQKSGESGKNSDEKPSSKSDSKQGDSKQSDSKQSSDSKSGKSDSDAGKSGAEKGDSGKSGSKDEGKSDSGKSESGKGKGKEGGNGQGSSQSSSGSKPSSGKGQFSGKGDSPGGGDPADGEGGDSTDKSNAAVSETGDDANLEYNRQATELILQKLKKDLERGDVDPELLEKLGWTPAELKKFADRLSKSLNESKHPEETPQSRARQQQFQEMLKNLDLKKAGSQRSGANEPKREVSQKESKRTPAPPVYQNAFDKLTKELARQQTPANSKPASK